LVTHEHADHVDEIAIAEFGCPIYAPAGANLTRVDFHPVQPGGQTTVAGVQVEVVGGQHAPVLDGRPDCPNVGYLVAGVYHPGDALVPAPHPITTLLIPMQASWLKTSEGIDFLRSSEYTQAFGIHDGQINYRAIESINSWYDLGSEGRYTYLPPGTSR
jgi:L-ascorbate metabolism protein UlaG (beta-lactamase superfamily)